MYVYWFLNQKEIYELHILHFFIPAMTSLNLRYSSIYSFISNIFLKWSFLVSSHTLICSSLDTPNTLLVDLSRSFYGQSPYIGKFFLSDWLAVGLMFGLSPTTFGLYLISFLSIIETYFSWIVFWNSYCFFSSSSIVDLEIDWASLFDILFINKIL